MSIAMRFGMMDTRTLSYVLLFSTFLICTSCNSKGQWQSNANSSYSTNSNSSGFSERFVDAMGSTYDGGASVMTNPPGNPDEPVPVPNPELVEAPPVHIPGKPIDPKVFCAAVNNPELMKSAATETLAQIVEWRTKMLTSGATPEQCLNSCPNPSDAMKDFCYSLEWCQKNCSTSQIIKNCSTNQAMARDSLCVANNCSPTPPPSDYYDPKKFIKDQSSNAATKTNYSVQKRTTDLQPSKEDLEIRKKIFLEITRKVLREYEDRTYTVIFADDQSLPENQLARYSEFGKAYQDRFIAVKNYLTRNPTPKSNYLQHLSETMLCINLPTNIGGENYFLEAMEQNNGCGNAFGFGQVISMTFYANLGLNLSSLGYSTAGLDKKCKNSPLQYLPTECGPQYFQPQFFRIELFDKYLAYTVDELFERRSFDMELQVRLMFATIINSFAMTQNWCGAFASYRGNGSCGYATFTPAHACMAKHLSAEYKSTSESGSL